MNRMLIINGRPFAGKRVFAKKIVREFEQFVMLPIIRSDKIEKEMTLFSYFSEQEQKYIGASRLNLIDLVDESKIPIIACNNTVTKHLLEFSEEWSYNAKTIFIDAELNISLFRFFEEIKTTNISENKAEIISQRLVEIIHEEQYSQHHISFDMVVKAKQIEKAGVKKVPKLFDEDNDSRVEVLRRFSSLRNTSHTIGLKTLIYNQIMAYGIINNVTIEPLVNAIVLCVECYKSRIEEEI